MMEPDDDPHNLNRFVEAQADTYGRAIAELREGRKRSHWMWFVFPQWDGLGSSPTATFYAIKSIAEAKAYLEHPMLGPRLLECAATVLNIDGRSAHEIFGSPDDWKLRSGATLFARVAPPGSVFERVLDKFYHGEPDEKTLALLNEK
jgi:uncharacterized protein (DUF1810 family)